MKPLTPYKSLAKLSIICLLYMGFFCTSTFANPLPQTTITTDSVNLSAADFLHDFASQTTERRAAARLYLLGVLDSSEGKIWCGYDQIKTATINEFVFEHLKKQSAERLKMRASVLIEEALKYHFPCENIK